jgi:hypothetical protein
MIHILTPNANNIKYIKMNEAKGKNLLISSSWFIRIFFLLALATSSLAQDSRPHYFYHALPYGSQANYNPLNVIINGGYGILQIPSYNDGFDRKIFRFPYQEWLGDMWETAGHPIQTINEFGWWRFFTTEVIPITFNMNNNQWVPNYFLHGIGAGMHFRATEEWFRYHGFSHPRLWSIGTMAVYHVLSEVIENRGNKEVAVNHIADLYIFDPLGIWAFTHDGVCRFFADKLQLTEWGMQPAYNFSNGNLENMGQFYVAKYPLSKDKRWSIMAHFGLHGMFGFSYRLLDEHSLSLTGGFLVENLIRAEKEGEGMALKAVLTWRAGLFYDFNNSLMASLMVATIPEYRIRVNLYPGILRLGPFNPGLFLSGSKEWVVGINFNYMPLGVAWGH